MQRNRKYELTVTHLLYDPTTQKRKIIHRKVFMFHICIANCEQMCNKIYKNWRYRLKRWWWCVVTFLLLLLYKWSQLLFIIEICWTHYYQRALCTQRVRTKWKIQWELHCSFLAQLTESFWNHRHLLPHHSYRVLCNMLHHVCHSAFAIREVH